MGAPGTGWRVSGNGSGSIADLKSEILYRAGAGSRFISAKRRNGSGRRRLGRAAYEQRRPGTPLSRAFVRDLCFRGDLSGRAGVAGSRLLYGSFSVLSVWWRPTILQALMFIFPNFAGPPPPTVAVRRDWGQRMTKTLGEGCCRICGSPNPLDPPHIIPRSHKGIFSAALNIVPLCRSHIITPRGMTSDGGRLEHTPPYLSKG